MKPIEFDMIARTIKGAAERTRAKKSKPAKPDAVSSGPGTRARRQKTLLMRASLTAKIYREFEIPGADSLYDLAEAIVNAFGFDFDHAFGFYSKLTGHIYDSPLKYELFADIGNADSEARSVKKTKIVDVFPEPGAKMTFLFDYGDDWQFKVEMLGEGQKDLSVKYPKLLKSAGKAPEHIRWRNKPDAQGNAFAAA